MIDKKSASLETCKSFDEKARAILKRGIIEDGLICVKEFARATGYKPATVYDYLREDFIGVMPSIFLTAASRMHHKLRDQIIEIVLELWAQPLAGSSDRVSVLENAADVAVERMAGAILALSQMPRKRELDTEERFVAFEKVRSAKACLEKLERHLESPAIARLKGVA